MQFQPLTVFLLCLTLGGLGGVWSATKPGEDLSRRRLFSEVLGSCCVGLGASLLLFERIGQSEFGQCTLLGLCLILGMLGRVGLEMMRDAVVDQIMKYGGAGNEYRSPPATPPETRVDEPDRAQPSDNETW